VSQFSEVKRSRGYRGKFDHSLLNGCSLRNVHILVDDCLKDEIWTEKLLDLLTDLLVQILGLRFILHLLSICDNNPSGTLALVESEALVLDRGIWSGVFIEALVGVVVGNALQ
jgi:hypothetical protein